MQCNSPIVAARLSVLAFTISSLAAQSLITDLATTPSGGSSAAITDIVVAGNQGFFAAQGPWGEELYVSDGTPAGTRLVKDLATRSASNPLGHSAPRDLTAFGNVVIFSAIVEGLGRELWISDGTAAGTTLLKDVSPGASYGNPGWLTPMGGLIYFSAYDGSGSGLWVTDGTPAGTVPVFSGGAAPTELAVVGGTIYFSLATPAVATELWRTDGTLAGTSLVVDLEPNGNSSPINLVPFQGGLLFSAAASGLGREPYFSDGTAAGTFRLADLNPTGSSNPADFTVVGGYAVFRAYVPVVGQELFVTDGTIAGTGLLLDILPGSAFSTPQHLTEYQGNVYFAANDGFGSELWRTDGTVAGTILFANSPTGAYAPSDLVVVGSELWFAATGQPLDGREPWKTDGTLAGTQMVLDVTSPASSSPTSMVPLGSGVLCSLTGTGVGAEPGFIQADGSSGGVVMDVDVAIASSTPDDFVAFPGGAFFTATSQAFGDEPFVTDGSAAGTTALEVTAGVVGSAPRYPLAVGGEVFFSAVVGVDRELWKTDGTAAGTVQLSDLNNLGSTFPFALAPVSNGIVFRGVHPTSGGELWASDGTGAGTSMIVELTPGPASTNIPDIVGNGTRALFSAYQFATGTELWSTDGTAAGTFLIELNPGGGSSSPAHIIDADGTFYFTASAGSSRVTWMSDGTIAGTVPLPGAGAGAGAPTNPFALTPSGSRVFGRGSMSGLGQELFVSDGTVAGTVGIDLVAGLASSVFDSLTGGAGGAFFVFDDKTGSGAELWFSDGTTAGTSMLRDIAPGYANGIVANTIVPILGGTQVAFVANDLDNGVQLWISDGTAAGTVPATSFGGNGVGAASFGEIFGAGADVFFAANDGVLGVEPWTLSTGSPFALEYGVGCAASGQPKPEIGSSGGLPSIGNAAFAVDVGNAVPNSIAALYLGFAPANVNVGLGCSVLLQFPAVSFGTAFTNASGDGSVPVPLPNNPAGIGLGVFFQYAVLSPTGPFLGFLDLSNGLHVQIGM